MPNFRVAQTWSLERADAKRALRFVEGLWRFWEQRGHLQEGEVFATQTVNLTDHEPDLQLRAAALYGAAIMPCRLGNFDSAWTLAAE